MRSRNSPPPSVQAKLLRALQEREFQRVGGTQTLRADVRLITATNRNLVQAVEGGKFREDLFYRLNVFSVHLPPLRERDDDVLLLAHHFLGELAPKLGTKLRKGSAGLSRDAQDVLRTYRWLTRMLKNSLSVRLLKKVQIHGARRT